PNAANRLHLGDFPSREPALSAAQAHYPNSTGCVYCTLDSRFYQAALDGLTRFKLKELARRFLVAHGLPVRRTLKQMWSDLGVWIQGTRSRCMALLEYVDNLRMWGRQRVFLFEVEDEYVEQLDHPDFIHNLEDGAYEQPAYIWDAAEPRLVHVKREGDLLIFKLVEMRKFDRLINNVMVPFEERSTNFLIINLRHRYAELRLQALTTRPRKNMRAERDLLLKELRKHLDIDGFSPIRLGKVMAAMIRKDIYPIDSITFKSGPSKNPVLLAFTQLFKYPVP